ncbi:DUF86 domain-containing protein [Candidatus Dependentiae bacterium]|nr:DUF86 domain-containing protein [Candidatus Dependentiae bacterium]
MHKRPQELFLVDILVGIDRINRNAAKLSFEKFFSDENIFNATTREFSMIGEAAKHLLDNPSFVRESDTEWRKIVDFRNLITHNYFGVIPKMVFEIIHEDVPKLEKDILNLINRKKDRSDILQAIADTKEELTTLNRRESVAYLEKIEKILK